VLEGLVEQHEHLEKGEAVEYRWKR